MKEPMNLANALIIIACIYFMITNGFNIWILLVLIFALVTWGFYTFTNDHKRLIKKQIEETDARIMNIKAHTAFMTTQSALTIKGIQGLPHS